jgi:hypothetical protein
MGTYNLCVAGHHSTHQLHGGFVCCVPACRPGPLLDPDSTQHVRLLYAVHQPFDSPGNPFALKVMRKPSDTPIFDTTGHRYGAGSGAHLHEQRCRLAMLGQEFLHVLPSVCALQLEARPAVICWCAVVVVFDLQQPLVLLVDTAKPALTAAALPAALQVPVQGPIH